MKAKQSLKRLSKDLSSYIRYIRYKYQVDRAFGKHKSKKNLPIRFVIFSFPRSGSELLCSMLHLHPEILCHRELFHPDKIFYSIDFHKIYGDREISREDLVTGKIGIDTMDGRNRSPESFLIKIWQYNFDSNAVGLKLLPSHNQRVAELLVRDKEIKKILLLRKNKIRCYVSNLIACKTRVWNIYEDKNIEKKIDEKNGKIKNNIAVKIDREKLKIWSQNYDRYFDSLRQDLMNSDQYFMELTYEDLVGDESESVKSSVLEFIGVSIQPDYLQEVLRKINKKRLSDLISNFDELKDKLRGTEFEPMLLD